jgi:hypothetical protein
MNSPTELLSQSGSSRLRPPAAARPPPPARRPPCLTTAAPSAQRGRAATGSGRRASERRAHGVHARPPRSRWWRRRPPRSPPCPCRPSEQDWWPARDALLPAVEKLRRAAGREAASSTQCYAARRSPLRGKAGKPVWASTDRIGRSSTHYCVPTVGSSGSSWTGRLGLCHLAGARMGRGD